MLVFEVGDHVGDWCVIRAQLLPFDADVDREHNMIRFVNGIPETVWLSQHSNGMAFTYEAMEKENGRRVCNCSPVGYMQHPPSYTLRSSVTAPMADIPITPLQGTLSSIRRKDD